jgi:glycosyltransferase involved in cell wall biosynthesis
VNDVEFTAFINSHWGPLDFDVATRTLAFPISKRSMLWLHLRLPFAMRDFPGIFHSPFNLLPVWMPIPAVVTIHDISFATHPQLFPFGKAPAYNANAAWATRKASHITTVSEWAREQIVERYKVSPERVHVVPNGVEPEFRPMDESDEQDWQAVTTRRGIRAPFVVAFGGAARRGLAVAIDAWRTLSRRGLPHSLVVLDQDGRPEPGMTWVTRPSDTELRLVLAGADLLLYPTETESFGMPALEAAACGTPAVCPRVGALPEVMGDAAAWCERDAEAIADTAEDLLRDPDRLAGYAERGTRLPSMWTWDEAASRLLSVYRSAAALI